MYGELARRTCFFCAAKLQEAGLSVVGFIFSGVTAIGGLKLLYSFSESLVESDESDLLRSSEEPTFRRGSKLEASLNMLIS